MRAKMGSDWEWWSGKTALRWCPVSIWKRGQELKGVALGGATSHGIL